MLSASSRVFDLKLDTRQCAAKLRLSITPHADYPIYPTWRPRMRLTVGTGIALDRDAVHAALVHPWSNGQTDGQIIKLKLVKRQMYGRAKLDLLEARMIGAA